MAYVLVVISYLAAYGCGDMGCPIVSMQEFVSKQSCDTAKQVIERRQGLIVSCLPK
jgi:hypothetical protein